MKYQNHKIATFINRPNRFIAEIEIDSKRAICHVKNTGRLKELLISGVQVLVEESDNPTRKTVYDLIAVQKGKDFINIDSQAPNKIAAEWLPESGLFPAETIFKHEVKCGNSRFDFCAKTSNETVWIEVKGITLNDNGIARFPDAPTERGVKHLKELTEIVEKGGSAMVLFVVQMKGITAVAPNDKTHPQFGDALRAAAKAGVQIVAVDCIVKPGEVYADSMLPILL
ncbi:MAG: DNA/RNA nuclease SfsA [Clostridia bacterium]|nr:DNA/RNA nuclease SfsA [Clostridia bacterium]